MQDYLLDIRTCPDCTNTFWVRVDKDTRHILPGEPRYCSDCRRQTCPDMRDYR